MHLAHESTPFKMLYKYIVVDYVDDLCIAAESRSSSIDIFKTKSN